VSAPQLVNPDRSITLPIQLGQLARLALPPSAAAAVAGWGVNDRTSQVGSMSRRPYVLFSQYFCPAVNQYRPRRTSSHTSSHRAARGRNGSPVCLERSGDDAVMAMAYLDSFVVSPRSLFRSSPFSNTSPVEESLHRRTSKQKSIESWWNPWPGQQKRKRRKQPNALLLVVVTPTALLRFISAKRGHRVTHAGPRREDRAVF
jgi:hypothetical protein